MSQPEPESLGGRAQQLPQRAIEVIRITPELNRQLRSPSSERVVPLDPRELVRRVGHPGSMHHFAARTLQLVSTHDPHPSRFTLVRFVEALAPDVGARPMRSFIHGALKCTISDTSLVFDSVQRTPLDSDWGCEIADYGERPVYADYLRAHFPPAMVEEIEALLRARGAFDRPREPVPLPVPSAPERGPSPPCTRLGLETLAAAIVAAFGSPLGPGAWSEVELEPYTRRCATSARVAGELRVELSLTEPFCDSIAGPRRIGASATIIVLVGERGRIDVAFPPLVVTGPRALLDVLVSAGAIDARSADPRG